MANKLKGRDERRYSLWKYLRYKNTNVIENSKKNNLNNLRKGGDGEGKMFISRQGVQSVI